jgi:hypothetical protein
MISQLFFIAVHRTKKLLDEIPMASLTRVRCRTNQRGVTRSRVFGARLDPVAVGAAARVRPTRFAPHLVDEHAGLADGGQEEVQRQKLHRVHLRPAARHSRHEVRRWRNVGVGGVNEDTLRLVVYTPLQSP